MLMSVICADESQTNSYALFCLIKLRLGLNMYDSDKSEFLMEYQRGMNLTSVFPWEWDGAVWRCFYSVN